MISITLPYLFGIAEEAPATLIPRTRKRAGELAEAFFLSKAESLNFHVSKPWGDSNRYDFIVDCGQTLSRVQLKCTSTISFRAYQIIPVCNLNGRHTRLYTPEEIDFIVCYIVPRAIWYVIPSQRSKEQRLCASIPIYRAEIRAGKNIGKPGT